MDGFSRKTIWLEAYETNSEPHIIVGYFINVIMETPRCLIEVRLDHGTEDTTMERILVLTL